MEEQEKAPNKGASREDKLRFFRNQQMRLSGRLRALNFKKLRSDDIDLLQEDSQYSKELFLKHTLAIPLTTNDFSSRLKKLRMKEKKYINEIGRSELFLATCFYSDQDLGIKAPLILIPIQISGEKTDIVFTISGEARINSLLMYKLAFEKTNQVPNQDDLEMEENIQKLEDIHVFQNKIHARFGLTDAYDGQMLEPFTEEITTGIHYHAVIAQMPRTTSAVIFDYTRLMSQRELSKPLEELIEQKKMDVHDPLTTETLPTLISSNASQDRIISEIMSGNNYIVQGPPGTGKSQLIANLIFQSLLQNKRILFVSEKKTAIDVVDERIGELQQYAMYVSDVRDKKSFFNRIKISVAERIKENQSSFFDASLGKRRYELMESLWNLHALLEMQKYAEIKTKKTKEVHIEASERLSSLHPLYNSTLPAVKILSKRNYKQLQKHFKSYIEEKSEKDLWILSSYADHKSYTLFDKVKRVFRRPMPQNKYQSEKISEALYVFNMTKKVEDIKSIATSESYTKNITEHILNVYTDYTDYIEKMNLEAKNQMMRFMSMTQPSDQLVHVSRLKTYPRKSLYNFVQENKDSLMKFYPIWIMSLDGALEVLPQEKEMFDYIIVDEGSQVEYSKILPLLQRSKNYVIVGDKEQLQPTEYFTTSIDYDQMSDEELRKELEDFEEGTLSIIDFAERVMDLNNSKMLMNHYRSSDERLIAFSNREFYNGQMNIISKMDFYDPNVLEVIDTQGVFDSDKGINEREIKEILSQVERMLKERPSKSIGIVVMNKQMENAVERALEEYRASNDEFDALLCSYESDESIDELIIKNLESIQGDERDTIIFAITYGINSKGNINNLGPITYTGGANRMNVAITRSKSKMVVIKSLKATQFEANQTHSEGRQLFHRYIQFLDKISENTSQVEGEFVKGLEQLKLTLEQKFPEKYTFKASISQGAYPIHMALIDKQTNMYVKGIICVDQIHWNSKEQIMYHHQFLTDRAWDVLYTNSKLLSDPEYTEHIIKELMKN